KAPAVIEGMVNIRGRLVPVLNLRRRFGLTEKPPHPAEHLLFATAGPRAVAMRVDRVVGAAEITAQDIDAPQTVTPGESPFTGVAKLDDGLVLPHALAPFLNAAEAADLDAAITAAKP